MTSRRERRRSFSEIENQPLDTAREAFAWLVTGPHPVAVDGRLFAGLPDRPVPLDELRDRLLRRTCPSRVRDTVWTHLVLRSRMEGATWTVGCVGMALPALIATAAKLSASFAGDTIDIHAAVLEGFVAELRRINLRKPKIALRLRWAAYRAGHACVREALDAPMPTGMGGYSSAAPPPPFGHPDLVLLRAVADGVLTPDEANLIGATRLERVPITRLTAQRGTGYEALKKARRRAEQRLRDYLTNPAEPSPDGTDTATQALAEAAISTAAHSTSPSPTVTTPENADGEKVAGRVSRSAAKTGVKGCGGTPGPSDHDSRSRRQAGPGSSKEVRRCA